MNQPAPESFSIQFDTNKYGTFMARCERSRAPVHADRIYNLARFGYYSDNYFFRVLPNYVAQFGTGGDPLTSNVYNYSSTETPECAILQPQPPYMPFCLGATKEEENTGKKHKLAWITRSKQRILAPFGARKKNCTNGLSNTFGTLSMSTSYNLNLPEYPNGVTWNATAELFINLADNSQRLDQHLFVPICTIEHMDSVVMNFPSFGEVAELGGPGPSLGLLYEQGNSYIESNPQWETMAKVERVTVCDDTVR